MPVEDALAKLKTLKATQPCAACGQERWEPQERFVAMPTVTGGRVVPTEGLECLALLCTFCGHVRFHSTGMLNKI
jgi:hypothetical protein